MHYTTKKKPQCEAILFHAAVFSLELNGTFIGILKRLFAYDIIKKIEQMFSYKRRQNNEADLCCHRFEIFLCFC